jgi:hypothetical protein
MVGGSAKEREREREEGKRVWECGRNRWKKSKKKKDPAKITTSFACASFSDH